MADHWVITSSILSPGQVVFDFANSKAEKFDAVTLSCIAGQGHYTLRLAAKDRIDTEEVTKQIADLYELIREHGLFSSIINLSDKSVNLTFMNSTDIRFALYAIQFLEPSFGVQQSIDCYQYLNSLATPKSQTRALWLTAGLARQFSIVMPQFNFKLDLDFTKTLLDDKSKGAIVTYFCDDRNDRHLSRFFKEMDRGSAFHFYRPPTGDVDKSLTVPCDLTQIPQLSLSFTS